MDLYRVPDDLPTPDISENARVVLEKRYLRKGSDGQLEETPQELFWRVAASIAAEETKYEKSPYKAPELARKFYDLMVSGRFLPNSPTLMNAGSKLGQLAACFVLPVGDSIEEIFDAVKHAALIHKSGGGTGFSFSKLRPANSRVGTTGGVASGPVSFLRIFNAATEQIKQGGRRRGANMGILRVDHPNILEFIHAKEKEGELNNFNLSVGLTERFMEAVEKNEEYDLIAPQSGEVIGRLNASEVFDLLAFKAWESGDPGIIFLDRINAANPNPDQGEIESTNPCGEQPLLPYEACNLGSINLAAFLDAESDDGIDWDNLRNTVKLCVRFLDNVIDASRYPLEQISHKVRLNRKIGLGLMGFADLLYRLRLPYNSQEALDLGERIMSFIETESRQASAELALERAPFPSFQSSAFAARGEGPYRNATTTTIAPTGTLSIIAGCSSGIEPLFALCFTRNILDGQQLIEVNPCFEDALKEAGLYSPDLMQTIAKSGGIHGLDMPEEITRIFVTAHDIEPIWHLKMQAAFQKYTDNAVSKTVNLPNHATKEQIREIYWMAYQYNCKGVTVYRDGCRSTQVLCSGEPGEVEEKEIKSRSVRERPDIVYGFTQKVKTGYGALYLTINEVEGKPFEVFTTIGKSGRSITAKAEAIGRLVSLAFRSGIEVADVVNQLKGIGGEQPVFQSKGLLLSIPDAIAWVLENRYLKSPNETEGNPGTPSKPEASSSTEGLVLRCPECDQPLRFQEGCYICPACHFTKCG